jgi:hypothetical protein
MKRQEPLLLLGSVASNTDSNTIRHVIDAEQSGPTEDSEGVDNLASLAYNNTID